MTLERFRDDFRGFVDLTDYTLSGIGPEAAMVRRLNNGKTNITSRVDLRLLALVACWRVACWDRSVTMIVTPTVEGSRALMAEAHVMMSGAQAEIRTSVFFHPRETAMSNPRGLKLGVIHSFSGCMGRDLPEADEPFTVILPNYDAIPGPHLTYLGKLASRPGTTIISNFVR